MKKLGVTVVSEALLRHIDRRALLLIDLVEAATEHSSERGLREGGSQLAERIAEMQEIIHELKAADSEDLMDAIEDFHQRLWLAQQKVDTWSIPANVRKAIEKKHAPKKKAPVAAPKRRRARRRKAA